MSHSPSNHISAESVRAGENWIPAEILATHPLLQAWSTDKTPTKVREVIDGVSKHLHGTRYDNLARTAPNPRTARGKVWDHMENVLSEGRNLNDYALPSAVELVRKRVDDFAQMHCYPPQDHMTKSSRDTFAGALRNRRDSVNKGTPFEFDKGMSVYADSDGRSR